MSTDYNVWAWDASATPLNNATADGQINWSEGQDPATVNNSARAMMTAIARQTDVQGGNVVVGNVGDAYTVTTGQTISAGHQALGFRICFRATATNTGAATVAVDGLSPVAIKRPNGDALSAGDIVNQAFHDIAFDGTNYRLLVPGAGGSYGSLSGGNTWTGSNSFNGTTVVGNDVADSVVIKSYTVSDFSAGILPGTSATAWRNNIGIGTAGMYNIGAAGATVPLLNASNTWSSTQHVSLSGAVALYLIRPDIDSSAVTGFSPMQGFLISGSVVAGAISSRGTGLSTGSTDYGTTSDARLKHARRPLDGSGEIIDQLEPLWFRWGDETGTEDFGLDAQAVHAVLPQSVIPGKGEPGEKDFVPWMRQHGRLEAILIAEIKALRARVAALEAG